MWSMGCLSEGFSAEEIKINHKGMIMETLYITGNACFKLMNNIFEFTLNIQGGFSTFSVHFSRLR